MDEVVFRNINIEYEYLGFIHFERVANVIFDNVTINNQNLNYSKIDEIYLFKIENSEEVSIKLTFD